MAKLLRKVILNFMLVCVALGCLYIYTKQGIIKFLSLVCGLVAFHFALRVYGGELVDKIFNNQINYKLWWFKEHWWEKYLHKLLGVKKWKNKMPTYDPDLFDTKKHSLKEILMAMCQAEVVHEINILLGFVPLITAIFLPEYFWFLLITSIFSGLIDNLFRMMQRYNIPRIRRLVDKQEIISQ